MQAQEKSRLIRSVSNVTCGAILTAFFLAMTLLIPVCVPALRTSITSSRAYPYVICSAATLFSLIFTIFFRKETHTFDFGIWPMVACCFLFYGCIRVVGFIAASVIISVILSRCWLIKSWKTTIAAAVITPLAIYVGFVLVLKVRLPSGIIFG